MSQPNDPDKNQSTSPAGGPPSGGSDGAAGASAETAELRKPGSAPGPGQQRGGLVPPWQRGPAEFSGQTPGEAGRVDPGRPGGPPPRGVVTGGTAAASMSGQQAPVKKLDAPPVGPPMPPESNQPGGRPAGANQGSATATDDGPRPKFVETPTRTIERDPSADKQLPDLDQIHHTEAQRTETHQTGANQTEAQRTAAVAAGATAATRPAPTQVAASGGLRASVQIRRLDPWATFKIVAVLSVVGFVIWMIAVAVLYLILDGMGVWDQVNSSFGTLVTADGSTSEGDIIGAGTVFGYAALLGIVNAVLITALATIGAYIYNICADLVGGAEVTLADLD